MNAPWYREMTPEYRFWSKVDKTGECWTWAGATSAQGYGTFLHGGENRRAHRVSYELSVGPIPGGAQIDHACRNEACVRPEHLRIASAAENMQNLVARSNSKSGIRGVTYRADVGKWLAKAQRNGEQHYLGLHATADSAERAVASWRRENMPFSEMDKKKEIA